MLQARRLDIGEPVDVLDIASGRLALVAPHGSGGVGAVLIPAHLLDPDPWFLSALGKFSSWTAEPRSARA